MKNHFLLHFTVCCFSQIHSFESVYRFDCWRLQGLLDLQKLQVNSVDPDAGYFGFARGFLMEGWM